MSNKKYYFYIFTSLVVLLIAGSVYLFIFDKDDEQVLEAEQIKELVSDYSLGRHDDLDASITSHELIVNDQDNNERVYQLPEESFFVSIAPYDDETHPCAVHSLTGCQGELVNQTFNLSIEDQNGEVIVNDTVTSMENGFIDIWLPRDETFNVTIAKDGKSVQQEISTFEGDDTCITTMQLQ
ncbi:CueP family metal-binding protein [Amphibacillus cookii]|uniref:CueP family metal-binding protein n=1 Tax=Amphibacillus cookii TaxID=767787 RepID=UPI00195A2F8D|nr:CueP family metal-binding protein [Amphibacillus cookii]MBM7542583.1 hypothetical protein [Amphibacillus cookii]